MTIPQLGSPLNREISGARSIKPHSRDPTLVAAIKRQYRIDAEIHGRSSTILAIEFFISDNSIRV